MKVELTRYVVLNPVRAKMVRRPEDWAWSSFNAMTGADTESQWLDVDWNLSQSGKDRTQAISSYPQFVMEGKGLSDSKQQIKHQMFLGNEAFTERIKTIEKLELLRGISKKIRCLNAYRLPGKIRAKENEAMAIIYPELIQWRK